MTATALGDRRAAAEAARPTWARGVRAVLRRTLRDQRRAPLVWGLPLGAMGALFVAIYPSVQDSLNKAVEGYPQGLKDAFRIQSFNSVADYLDAELFSLILPLALAFFAIRSVARVLAGGEDRRYLDVVLAAPLARRWLVAGTFLATACSSAAVLVIFGAIAWLASAIAGSGLALDTTLSGVASVWPLTVFFGGVAVLAAGFLGRSAVVTGVAVSVLAGMYVIDIAGRIADALDPLRYASAFRYYGSALTEGFDPVAFAGLTIAGALLAAAGAALFERRDIRG